MNYMNTEQRNALLELSDSAVILYLHYLSKTGAENYSFSDSEVAKTLPWKESKIARVRKQLEKAGWFKRVNFRQSICGQKAVHVYLGKEAVDKSDANVSNIHYV